MQSLLCSKPLQHADISRPRRLAHLDFLRLFAIFFVIFNHTDTFFMPTALQSEAESWFLYFSNQICKTAIPLFFMISGALLLPREESYKLLFQKRVLRFLGVLLFFWILQYLANAAFSDAPLGFSRFLNFIYFHGDKPEHIAVDWFLYAYLAMLLLLPLLRLLARNMRNRDFLYLAALQFVIMALLPSLICLLTGEENPGRLAEYLPFNPSRFDPSPFGAGFCAFFMLMGYFLEHRVDPKILRERFLQKLSLLALLCLCAGAVMMAYSRSLRPDGYLLQTTLFLTCFLPLPCAVIYLLARAFFSRALPSPHREKLLAIAASGVLTVMLTENLFRQAFHPIAEALKPLCGQWLSCVPVVMLSYCCALLLGVILHRLPLLRRIL